MYSPPTSTTMSHEASFSGSRVRTISAFCRHRRRGCRVGVRGLRLGFQGVSCLREGGGQASAASEGIRLGSLVHTLYSGRRRSSAQARASSQWKVPLCVPIRGGAMRLLRGLLGGGSGSEPSMRCWAWRTDRSGNSVRIPRRKPLPIWFPPQEGRPGRGSAWYSFTSACHPSPRQPGGKKPARYLVQAFLQLLKTLFGTSKRQRG